MIEEEHIKSDKQYRAKKMMLWFGMLSIAMTFAGLTSAYLISKSRPDWIKEITLPPAFAISTLIIVCSSITFQWAKHFIRKNKRKNATILLLCTLFLGLGFVASQIIGYQEIINLGYNFTGPTSTISVSFFYVISFLHLLHVIAGILVLLVVIYNHFKKTYTSKSMLGLELGLYFWHFLDIVWLYLFVFFYFLR